MSAAPLQDYSRTEKLLHWLALQPESVRRMSFDLERQFYLPDDVEAAASGSVYVCGLARSGTTLVLQLLDQLPCFRSLTYRDMPFVLAPNLWRRVAGLSQRSAALFERAHGDGVMVGYDSAESFEEVFWRTFSRSADPSAEGYGSCEVDDEALKLFAQYRAMVANPRGQGGERKRYLSKNNDNLLRFHRLAEDPTATVLLVYRNPIDTALSLHRQHMRFMERKDDPFVARYMGWLGHHEFGPGHMPFSVVKRAIDPALDANRPNYWLDYWIKSHEYISEINSNRVMLVNYESLIINPSLVLNYIVQAINLDMGYSVNTEIVRDQRSEKSLDADFDLPMLEVANKIYKNLEIKFKKISNHDCA